MERRRPRSLPLRPLVLIVDDDADTREMYAISLPAFGFDVLAADGAEHAYERAWTSHPDILLTDVTLAGSDGWTLVQHLKNDPRTRDIPVVVLTGHSSPSWRERAIDEGCAGFLVKPCLPEQLASELRVLLNRIVDHEHASAT